MRALDVVQRLALGQVAGHLQVQGQRGQLVAEQVMQLARNAGALVDPRTLGQQGPGGAQLRIEPALLVAGLGLLSRDQAGHEDEHGKAAIQQRLHHCFEQREAQQHVVDRRDRQLADQQPQHSQPHRQHPRDDPGGHHHQDAAQARAAEEADPQRRDRQQQQQATVQPAGMAVAAQDAGEPVIGGAERQVGDEQQDRPAAHVAAAVQVLELRVGQRQADHDPGEQAGQTEDAGMAEDSQHASTLRARAASRTPTEVMPARSPVHAAAHPGHAIIVRRVP